MCLLLIYPLAFVVTGKCFFELAFMGGNALLSLSMQEDKGPESPVTSASETTVGRDAPRSVRKPGCFVLPSL